MKVFINCIACENEKPANKIGGGFWHCKDCRTVALPEELSLHPECHDELNDYNETREMN